MNMFLNKKYQNKIIILVMFLVVALFTFADTTSASSGGTGIFDALFDLLRRLIIDYRLFIILAGVLGIMATILGEMFMSDMSRTIRALVISGGVLSIGISAEIFVRFLGGSMLNPQLITENSLYINLIIGV